LIDWISDHVLKDTLICGDWSSDSCHHEIVIEP